MPPVIPACLEPLWDAFWQLSSSRPYVAGMGGGFPLPIPYSELSAYAWDAGFEPGAPEWVEFFTVLRAMDAEFLTVEKERADAADDARARQRAMGGDVR